MGLRASLVWLCVLLVPVFEVAAHATILAHVPSEADYRAAAAFIRSGWAARDLVASAPDYIDPIVRLMLGNRIGLAMAGRSDDAAYERMWVLSIRGAMPRDAPRRAPELSRQFGRVRVLRFALGESPVLFDFTSHVRQASASIVRRGRERPCAFRQGGLPRGGGLGKAVLTPLRERFECDPAAPWASIGAVVTEDLHNTPRYCIWQRPLGPEPVTLRFADVPLGDALVFYGGLYYEDERMREGGPVAAQIAIDGKPLARFVHRDGDGWKRLRVDTSARAGARARVSVAVSAADPARRGFCWSMTTRRAVEGREP